MSSTGTVDSSATSEPTPQVSSTTHRRTTSTDVCPDCRDPPVVGHSTSGSDVKKLKRPRMERCTVVCCKSTTYDSPKKAFFPCPDDALQRINWVKAIGGSSKVTKYRFLVCEKHFCLDEDLENYIKFKFYPTDGVHKLKKDAVPSKFPCLEGEEGASKANHKHRMGVTPRKPQTSKKRAHTLDGRNDEVTKKVKVVASGHVSTSRFGYPSELKKTSRALVELVDETAASSSTPNRAKLEFLNGDISQLIAHVQPSIRSWDVSVVDINPPSLSTSSLSRSAVSTPAGKDSKSQTNNKRRKRGVRRAEKISASLASDGSKDELSSSSHLVSSSSEGSTKKGCEPEVSTTVSQEDVRGKVAEVIGYSSHVKDQEDQTQSPSGTGEHEKTEKPPLPPNQSCKISESHSQANTVSSKDVRSFNQTEKDEGATSNTPKVDHLTSKREGIETRSMPNEGFELILESKVAYHRTRSSNRTKRSVVIARKSSDSLKSERANRSRTKSTNDTSEEGPSSNTMEEVMDEGSSPKKTGTMNRYAEVKAKKFRSDSERVCPDSSTPRNSGEAETTTEKSSNSSEASPSTPSTSNKPRLDVNPNRSNKAESELELNSLEVNMNETKASYQVRDSGTVYSYKPIRDTAEKNGSKESSRFLVVKEKHKGPSSDSASGTTEYDFTSSAEELPSPMADLLKNMKTYFDNFFSKLDELKGRVTEPNGLKLFGPPDSSNPGTSPEKVIETLEEDVKMFPALLSLEMTQFVLKCKEFYLKETEEMLKSSKKVRWCAACLKLANFHCCYKAAYCSRKCQDSHWANHKTECCQEEHSLLDPQLQLNSAIALRVKTLNKSRMTISDLEKLYMKYGVPYQGKKPVQVASKTQSSTSKADDNSESVLRRSTRKSNKPISPKVSSESVPVGNNSGGLVSGEKRSTDVESLEMESETADMESDETSRVRVNRSLSKEIRTSLVNDEESGGAANSQKTAASQNGDNFLSTFAVKSLPTLTPQFLAGLPGSVGQAGTGSAGTGSTTSATQQPATTKIQSFILPKNMVQLNNGSRGVKPFMLKFRTVTLPNGETRLIPAELPTLDGQSYTIKTRPTSLNMTQTSSAAAVKPVPSSGSILITRPTKPATSSFKPLTLSSSSTQPVYIHQANLRVSQRVSTPSASPQYFQPFSPPLPPPVNLVTPLPALTPAPFPPLPIPLPTLTPIAPRNVDSSLVRTLNDDELDKILNTDHLLTAFDSSYYANTRIKP